MSLALLFNLGDDVYGLEIEALQEIVENPVLHHVPQAQGVLKGAINFHGQILAVIDLPDLLGITNPRRDHRRVVLSPEYKSLVLTVSGIQRIVTLDLTDLQPPPENSADAAIRGQINLDETMINMLDTNAIFKQLQNIYAE
ncbi:MAG: chemotaxis protein CheW [Desulfuromonadales bacterium]